MKGCERPALGTAVLPKAAVTLETFSSDRVAILPGWAASDRSAVRLVFLVDLVGESLRRRSSDYDAYKDRALFYNEHEGYLETFRPYAQPSLTELGVS